MPMGKGTYGSQVGRPKKKMMHGGEAKTMYGGGMSKKKVEMMVGGMANGKKHMYAGGGSVMDNLTPAQRNMMKKMAEGNK